MIGSRTSGLYALGSALPLAIGEDRETHATIDHDSVVDADVLFARRRVKRVRVVRDVGPMHGVHHAGRLDVAALRGGAGISGGDRHLGAALAPDVALENVVIVREADRGGMAHHVPKRPTELIKFSQVIENRGCRRLADDTEAAVALVNLVAGKEYQIGLQFCDVAGDGFIGESVVVLAGHRGQAQRSADGIGQDRAGPLVRRDGAVAVLFAVDEFVGDGGFLVPVWNAERGDPGVGIEFCFAQRLPRTVALHVQFHELAVVAPHGTGERTDLHDPAFRRPRITQ